MAHKFAHTRHDPYVEAAHQVEEHVFTGEYAYGAGAGEEIYGAMANAIVTALGDIGAAAFRLGVNQPQQIKGLAKAVAAASDVVLTSYLGEVDPETVLRAITSDPRIQTLTEIDRDQLEREVEKTRQLEELILDAKRLPELLDLADSLDLRDHTDALEAAEVVIAPTQLPSPE